MDYCPHRIFEDPEKPSASAVAAPNEPKVKLVKQCGSAQVPRESLNIDPRANYRDNILPHVLQPEAADSTVDHMIRSLDALQVTDSEDEAGSNEMKAMAAKYEQEAPAWSLNRFQLQKAFKSAYDSKYGIRASMADSRIGAYLQRIAKKYYQAARISQTWNEATFRVFLENKTSETCFESFYSEPGLEEGPRLKWDKIGSFYPIIARDGFGFYYIRDLRIWVRSSHKM